MKTVAISQSNYIPWIGYFDFISKADDFIFLDTVQFTKRDWRSRNKILIQEKEKWLSIPVNTKSKFKQKICETTTVDDTWKSSHLQAIMNAYGKSIPDIDSKDLLEMLYLDETSNYLSKINQRFLTTILKRFQIHTNLSCASSYSNISNHKTERLVDLCVAAKATHYMVTPTSFNYLDPSIFDQAGIQLKIFEYPNYLQYRSTGSPTSPLSIIDAIATLGKNTQCYMKTEFLRSHAYDYVASEPITTFG